MLALWSFDDLILNCFFLFANIRCESLLMSHALKSLAIKPNISEWSNVRHQSPKRLVWLIGSISRNLTMTFSFILFLLKIFPLKSLSLLPSLLLLLFLRQRRTCFRFRDLPKNFYHLPPCGYDLHSHYAVAKVLREAKAHKHDLWFQNTIFCLLVFTSIKFCLRCRGGNVIFTNLLKNSSLFLVCS